MKKILNEEHLRAVVLDSKSVREVQQKLGYKESGGIHKFLKIKFELYGIDTSHFHGQGWSRGSTRETDTRVELNTRKRERASESIFRKGSQVGGGSLLRRLVKQGDKSYKCENCGISSWGGVAIRLQIHHKNGDNTDNRKDNLTILCPNCHSQTDTFSRSDSRNVNTKSSEWWIRLSMTAGVPELAYGPA
jgi:hypothetical protein